MDTVELFCKLGKHTWERESQRGRRPENCPKHTPAKPHAPEPVEGERFTEEELAADYVMDQILEGNHPSFKDLAGAMEKQGHSDCILESAHHLPDDQYERLEELTKRYPDKAPYVKVRNGR